MLVYGRQVLDWLSSYLGHEVPETEAAIGWMRDGRIVAGVYFDLLQPNNVFCHIAASERLHWKLIGAAMRYAYDQLGLERMTLAVEDDNGPAKAFVEGLGAAPESRLARAGNGCDVILYALWADNRFRRKLCETGRY